MTEAASLDLALPEGTKLSRFVVLPIHPRFQNILRVALTVMQVTGIEPAFSAPITDACFVDRTGYTCIK